MRRVPALILCPLALVACQPSGSDGRTDAVDAAESRERARQEKAAREMVAQTEDQVRVKMLEQRIATLEAQVAALQGDRKLLDAQLVEQRLNQIELERVGAEAAPGNVPAPTAASASSSARGAARAAGSAVSRPATPRPTPSATPPARKPLVLDLR
ncbi:hypothetical protein ACFX59_01295 [Sphingomonas sp. NCPPB 2930]|uniref:hypothetical protein n=1 Tax=Sphingomonas sp. NCPPB 2930 TaxID=3162788 RepID=UPI0036DA3D2C